MRGVAILLISLNASRSYIQDLYEYKISMVERASVQFNARRSGIQVMFLFTIDSYLHRGEVSTLHGIHMGVDCFQTVYLLSDLKAADIRPQDVFERYFRFSG